MTRLDRLTFGFSVVALGLAACAADTGSVSSKSQRIDNLAFAAPLPLKLTDRSAARMAVARRFATSVPTQVSFPMGSSQLSDTAQVRLKQQAAFMQAYPELAFFVVGQSDPGASHKRDNQLAKRRAETVAAFLIEQGVPARQVTDAISYAQLSVTSETDAQASAQAVTEVADFHAATVPDLNDLTDRPI